MRSRQQQLNTPPTLLYLNSQLSQGQAQGGGGQNTTDAPSAGAAAPLCCSVSLETGVGDFCYMEGRKILHGLAAEKNKILRRLSESELMVWEEG